MNLCQYKKNKIRENTKMNYKKDYNYKNSVIGI